MASSLLSMSLHDLHRQHSDRHLRIVVQELQVIKAENANLVGYYYTLQAEKVGILPHSLHLGFYSSHMLSGPQMSGDVMSGTQGHPNMCHMCQVSLISRHGADMPIIKLVHL